MGGGFAVTVAARTDVQVAAINYAVKVPNDSSELTGICPVVVSYGEEDSVLPDGQRLKQLLVELGAEHVDS